MIKSIIKKIYHATHDAMFDTLTWNPLFPKQYNGKKVKIGHISSEHLARPELDEQLVRDLRASGIPVEEYTIDIPSYKHYLKKAGYPDDYFGGGKDPKRNFVEKTLEHYVSTQFMDLHKEATFIDIAACDSPFHHIMAKEYGMERSYQQDLIFPKGLHGHQIGGYGHELPFGENSINAVTLHCSLEHFEGQSDTFFFQTLEKQLKPGGVAVVLPFYLAYEYTIHTDPIYNLAKRHRVNLDDNDRFRLRYSNWYQFYSRHYDPQAIHDKILKPCPDLELIVYRVTNFKEVASDCYLRFVGVFRKKDLRA